MAPVDATSNSYENHNKSSDVHVESINRMATIPVVKSALGIATGLYSRVKESNPIVGSGLSRAEQTVLLVADSAKPVIQKLEKPINYADSLVCHGLDKLEENLPIVKKSPEEIKASGWVTYESVKTYGWSQVENVKNYVTSTAEKASSTSYGQVVIRSVDSALQLTESALDNYLPPGEGEQTGQDDEDVQENGPVDQVTPSRLVRKASRVSDKMRRRLIRTDLLLMKRALGLLKPVQQIGAASQ